MPYATVLDLIGKTPMVKLSRIVDARKHANIYVKLEYLNPSGSHKDRIAYYMVSRAVSEYGLKPGDVVVEATSGNTGIAVTLVARMLGLKPVIVVSEDVSSEKLALLKLLGAEVIYGRYDVPDTHPKHIANVAKRVAEERGGVYLNQFANAANVIAHYMTTAREIWEDLNGEIDAFVMGVGTGGTIVGVGRYLKERRKDVLIVAVTPKGSVLAGGKGEDIIEGLSSHKVSEIVAKNRDIIDRVIEVSQEEAAKMCMRLAREEGILGGFSTGANVYAALKVAEELGPGKNVVTIAPDSLLRYVKEFEKYIENK